MNKLTPATESFWFGRTFKISLLLIFIIELFSFLNHSLNQVWGTGNLFFCFFAFLLFCLTLYRLEYGLFAVLIELLIGSQGHYFDLNLNGQIISIRIALFAIVVVSFLYHSLRKKEFKNTLNVFLKNKYLIILALVFIWGLISALLNENSFKNIFNDFNAWLYFLYLFPIIYVLQRKTDLRKLWPILTAGITAVSLKSLFFLYVFSHKFTQLPNYLYDWGRDMRWGEFTLVSGGLYRIFSQAQIWSLIACLIILVNILLIKKFKTNKKEWLILSLIIALNLATVLLSLSRSYWVGLIVAGITILMFAIFYYRLRIYQFATLIGKSLIIALLSSIVLIIALFFPLPQQTVLNPSSALNSRFDIGDQAGASRWNQLPQLFEAISQHPIIGSGWGTTVTYESRDPRIVTEDNPTGVYTTYAFEWGYLDIILKIGLFGLFIYLLFIFQIVKKAFILLKNKEEQHRNALLIGLFVGLIALLGTHMFSPYLNHPLGIGYLLIFFTTVEYYSRTAPTKSL
ncbi:MAG: hypothetical protein UT02_C0004G0014 [Parcubacteria group bacterium GW2011_GWC2_38_7]|nr:MAG: hypothetical protein UT02_C0004G0014 [Parcubacteria group bacterium GW2011_GWC2_38_7]